MWYFDRLLDLVRDPLQDAPLTCLPILLDCSHAQLFVNIGRTLLIVTPNGLRHQHSLQKCDRLGTVCGLRGQWRVIVIRNVSEYLRIAAGAIWLEIPVKMDESGHAAK